MNKSYFVKLVDKYLKGNATAEESQFLIKYYDLFDSEEDIALLLNESEKKNLENKLESEILQNIDLHERKKSVSISPRKLWISRIAIAATVLVVFTMGIYVVKQESRELEKYISQYNHTKTPRLISLPDGSTVIMSAGSKLRYPITFEHINTREVNLEGQAYFDIKHNASKPFIIHTGKVATTVLGTAFNIKAWPLDPQLTITVERGKVKIDEKNKILGVITPNQQIIYNTKEKTVLQQTVDAQLYLKWKNEDLLLNNVTIGEAVKLLATRYDVHFSVLEEDSMTKRFTTQLLKGERLETILQSICEFNGVKYEYDKEKAEVLILLNSPNQKN